MRKQKGKQRNFGPKTEKKPKVSARKYDALLQEYNQLLQNDTGVQLMLAAMILKNGSSTDNDDEIEFFLEIDDIRQVAGSKLASETVTIDDITQTRLVVQLNKPAEVSN